LHFNKSTKDKSKDNSLIAIDSLKVDDRVRITLTKEVRNAFNIKAGDTIAIFQNKDSDEFVLRVQRKGSIKNTLVVNKSHAYTSNQDIPSMRNTGRNSTGYLSMGNYETHLSSISDSANDRYFPRIVVIDDDSSALLTFQSYLQSEGFAVQIFSNSTDAVEYLESHHSDYKIVISDIRMPQTNGLKLYQKLKSIDKDIKIMFITALDIVDEVLSMFPDFDEKYIMRKPIKREQFVRRVESLIESY
jgi:CheY-like chemotaxis protein/bifunctional DNA-binding transcriptional regulator/antitoxin component of YhaV-PrlF toxin-antitoxin module